MDILDDEILNFWKLLYKNEVAYIMVGGFAINLHGYTRTTADLDIWIKDTKENRKRLRKTINETGHGDIEEIETMQFVPGWSTLSLDSGIELDIMTDLKGLSSDMFDECFNIAPVAHIHEIPVKFLHLNQLIESKKATGRPRDLSDLIELEKISDAQKQRK